MHKLTVIGGGPGNADLLVPAGAAAIQAADIVIADARYLPLIRHENVRSMGKIMDTVALIRTLSEHASVALVVSGDPLIYSLYKTISRHMPDIPIEIIPGIGSMQMFAAKLGETVENACFLSTHGRNMSKGTLALKVYEHEKVFLLCDKEKGPAWMAQAMLAYGLEHVHMYAMENVSYENEKLTTGTPEYMAERSFGSLCVVLIKNDMPAKAAGKPLLADDDFIRDKTPMTKEEIRWTILGKLKLSPDAVVWDLGAGTGSVSVECARQCPFGQVYAVERNDAAADLIQKNKEKFDAGNLHIINGTAAEMIKNLPVPTHVFIGGSGSEMAAMTDHIRTLGSDITVMAACVTVETLAQATGLFKEAFGNFEMIQMHVSRSRTLGAYHILDSNNPVTLIWAKTKQ